MRAVLFSAGSRGDFQPMLALAVALRARGHEVLLTGSASAETEAAAFGVPFRVVGMDVKKFIEEEARHLTMNPFHAVLVLVRILRAEYAVQLEHGLPLARGADVIVAGGPFLAAATIAELERVPYRHLAYTPQLFRSDLYTPFLLPWTGMPKLANRAAWGAAEVIFNPLFASVFNPWRAKLGLPRVRDAAESVFPPERSILAVDAELCHVPPELRAAAVGSLELPDDRALPPEVERFLASGPAPIYVGFGSMPDTDPPRTTRVLVDAIRSAGVRALLSRGWAGLGDAHEPLPESILAVGPLSHRALFPRLAAVVHHGGAGTTHAVARAGVPQVVVPHAFDQFQFAHWAHQAGVATPPLVRTRLSWSALADRILGATHDAALGSRARALGIRLRARNPLAAAVDHVEAAASRDDASARRPPESARA